MRPFRHILVAVKDPDAKWSLAIAKAAQIARSSGAGIHLFHAVDTRLYVDALATYEKGVAEFEAGQTKPYRQKLEQLAQHVRSHGILVTTETVVDHPVYESILREAGHVGADLIVTDCHAGHHFAPALLQLTDWELARLSPVPVLIVRKPRLYHRPTVLCAVDPRHAYAKPAELESQILAAGAEICTALRGTLHAVHAYPPLPNGGEVSTACSAGNAVMIDAVAAGDARSAFDRVLRSAAIPVEHRHLIAGHPADAIEHVIAETGAEILVVGSISRSGLRRLLVGNTAEKLLYRLPCDVLVVKPADFASQVASESRGARWVVTPACN